MKTTYFAPNGGISKIAGNIPLHDFFKVSKKIIEQPIQIEVTNDINSEIDVESLIISLVVVCAVVGVIYYWDRGKEDDKQSPSL